VAPRVDAYGANYAGFSSDLYAEVRREAYGEDFGQMSWLTAGEHDEMLEHLALAPGTRTLDLGSGAGGPTLRLARRSGASVVGIEAHPEAVREARARASREGLGDRVTFEQADAAGPLPFPDGSFGGAISIDAINHLPDRARTLAAWARVLAPAARLVFTDPTVVTGPLTAEEIAGRSVMGFYLFVPPGENERGLREAGLRLDRVDDRSADVAAVAARRRDARARHREALIAVEGRDLFEGQQAFLELAGRLAAERRLSRFRYVATKG
jgi:SAM-dependent methyltransferase